ncbi:MAG TPA: hypothetical protein VJB14_16760 [Planctomycetota bacterium]|nr:hypothetical protein [Planctomycetota bacterium]
MIGTMVEWIAAALLQASGPSAYVEPQDPDRPALPLADLKSLRENNIYSPHKIVRKDPPRSTYKPSEPKPPPPPPKPVPPVVTGIILDPVTKEYQVVVEDKNSERLKLLKAPLFLKAGDEVLVYRIESVTTRIATVKWGETTKELKVGDSFPDAGLKAPEGAETTAPSTDKPASTIETKPAETPSGEASPDEEKRRKIREELQKRLNKKRKYDEEP